MRIGSGTSLEIPAKVIMALLGIEKVDSPQVERPISPTRLAALKAVSEGDIVRTGREQTESGAGETFGRDLGYAIEALNARPYRWLREQGLIVFSLRDADAFDHAQVTPAGRTILKRALPVPLVSGSPS